MQKKNVFHIVVHMFFMVFAASILGMFMMWLAYLLPVEPMAENMVKSYDTIRAQDTWDDEYLAAIEWAEILDTGTNIIIFHEIIYPNTGNAFEDSLLVPGGNTWDNMVGDWTAGLMEFAQDRDYTDENTITYARYWHGYLVLLKPLFLFMQLDGIYILNTIAIVLLTIAVLFLMWKRLGWYSAAYLFTILAMHPENIVQSFQLSSVFYALNITMLLLFLKKDWKEEQKLYIFVLDGILIAFFDFLTYPFVALAIPMLTCFLMDMRPNFLENLVNMIKIGFSFLFGYAGMWGMKWIFATIFTSENVIYDAIISVLHRTGMAEGTADVMKPGIYESLYRNIVTFFDDGNTLVLLCGGMLALLFVILNRKKLEVNKQILIMCLLMIVAPFAWLIVLNNHCSLHPHLEWRTLNILLYAVAILVISTFYKRKEQING